MMENSLLMSAGGDCKVKFWEISDKILPNHALKENEDKNLNEEEEMLSKTAKK